MPSKKKPDEGYEEAISPEEIATFAKRLSEWGSRLPEKERALLHLMLANAERKSAGSADFSIDSEQYIGSIHDTVRGLFRSLVGGNVTFKPKAAGWVQLGEPWIQWSARSSKLTRETINPGSGE